MNTTTTLIATTITAHSSAPSHIRQCLKRRTLKFFKTKPLQQMLLSGTVMLLGLVSQVGQPLAQRQAQAAPLNYSVSLNTSDLQGFDSQQPFALDFLLTNANGVVGNGSSTPVSSSAVLNAFNFGTAPSSEPAPGTFGTATTRGSTSGSIDSGTLTLNENPTGLRSEFVQNFNPGNLLSFNLAADNQNTSTDTPDSFSFFVRNASGSAIQTFDAQGNASSANQLFTISFNGDGSQSVQTFGFRDASGNIVSPTVAVQAVPEPQTWAMFALGLGAILWTLRRRKLPQTGWATSLSSTPLRLPTL